MKDQSNNLENRTEVVELNPERLMDATPAEASAAVIAQVMKHLLHASQSPQA
jgi:hypothetical protein